MLSVTKNSGAVTDAVRPLPPFNNAKSNVPSLEKPIVNSMNITKAPSLPLTKSGEIDLDRMESGKTYTIQIGGDRSSSEIEDTEIKDGTLAGMSAGKKASNDGYVSVNSGTSRSRDTEGLYEDIDNMIEILEGKSDVKSSSSSEKQITEKEPSWKDKLKDKLASVGERIRNAFAEWKLDAGMNFKAFKEYFSDRLPGGDERKMQRLNREHLGAAGGKKPEFNPYGTSEIEKFADLKWTGDLVQDTDTFIKFSNILTTAEDQFDKDAARNKKERAHELKQNGKSIHDEAATTLTGVRDRAVNTMFDKASPLQRSELPREALQQLADKFREHGHTRKAAFVDKLIANMDEHPVTESKEELEKQKQIRELERRAGVVVEKSYTDSKLFIALTSHPTSMKSLEGKLEACTVKWLHEMSRDVTAENKGVVDFGPAEFQNAMNQKQADAITNMVKNSSASDLFSLDLKQYEEVAKKFQEEGKDDIAKFLSDFVGKVKYARTPEGCSDLFGDLALQGVKDAKDPNTFLRNTGDKGTAAIKKLVDMSGGFKFQENVRPIAEKMCEDPSLVDLAKRLNAKGIKSIGSGDITEEIGKELCAVALKMQSLLLQAPVPEGVKNILSKLTTEFEEGDNKNSLVHKLYADQLVLKGLSPAVTTLVGKDSFPEHMQEGAKIYRDYNDGKHDVRAELSRTDVQRNVDVVKIAMAIVQKIANQTEAGMSEGMVKAIREVKQQAAQQQDVWFVKQGMPQSSVMKF